MGMGIGIDMEGLIEHIKKSIIRQENQANVDRECLKLLLIDKYTELGFKSGVMVNPIDSTQTYRFTNFVYLNSELELFGQGWNKDYLVSLRLSELELSNCGPK